jgi:hypothetical protein
MQDFKDFIKDLVKDLPILILISVLGAVAVLLMVQAVS